MVLSVGEGVMKNFGFSSIGDDCGSGRKVVGVGISASAEENTGAEVKAVRQW